jgi:hypothetical protein
MKPPYVKITAKCDIHGQLHDERKPNKLKDRPKGREGLYDAIRCTKCGLWATIISQQLIAVTAPAEQAAPELTLSGMEV